MNKVTSKKIQVLRFIQQKKPIAEMAKEMGIVNSAVKQHITSLYKFFKCSTREDLLVKASPYLHKNHTADPQYPQGTIIYRQEKCDLYNPKTSSPVSLSDLKHIKNLKVLTPSGEDVTEQITLKAKDKELKKTIKAPADTEAGQYCNCTISSRYKNPSEVPDFIEENLLLKVGRYNLVPVDKDGTCQFCGFNSVYFDKDPNQKHA